MGERLNQERGCREFNSFHSTAFSICSVECSRVLVSLLLLSRYIRFEFESLCDEMCTTWLASPFKHRLEFSISSFSLTSWMSKLRGNLAINRCINQRWTNWKLAREALFAGMKGVRNENNHSSGKSVFLSSPENSPKFAHQKNVVWSSRRK